MSNDPEAQFQLDNPEQVRAEQRAQQDAQAAYWAASAGPAQPTAQDYSWKAPTPNVVLLATIQQAMRESAAQQQQQAEAYYQQSQSQSQQVLAALQAAAASRLSGSPGQTAPVSVVIGPGITGTSQGVPLLYGTGRGRTDQLQQAWISAVQRQGGTKRLTGRQSASWTPGGFATLGQDASRGQMLAAWRQRRGRLQLGISSQRGARRQPLRRRRR